MDLSGDMPVTLVIKAPSQRMDDQVVDCVLSWTIKKLKKHLENVYPSRPKYNEQRLIYSGRLLQDQLVLKDVLKQYDDSSSNRFTLHLVCSSTTESSLPSTKSFAKEESKPPVHTTSYVESNSSNVSTTSDGLRQRSTTQMSSSTTPNTAASTTPNTATYPASYGYPDVPNPYFAPSNSFSFMSPPGEGQAYNPEQYAVMMQQMYAQYMAQYMQYYQNFYNPDPRSSPWFQPYPTHLQPDWSALAQGPNNGNAAGDGAANNQAAPRQNVRMNAQGGMEQDDEDDGEPRDWLHHAYFMMRVLTFMGILFFYSNLTRFLVVFAGSFVVYFLQKFRKHLQRRERELQQQRQQREEHSQQEQGEQPQNAQNAEVPGDTTPESPAQDNVEAVQNQANEQADEIGPVARLFLFACNTIQMFFTSLLPNPPELLEPN